MAIDGLSGLSGMVKGLESQASRGLGQALEPRASGVAPLGPVERAPQGIGPVEGPSESSFENVLSRAIGELEATHATAESKSMALITGQDVAVHDVMAAVTEAEIAVQMTSAIAVKAIAAYQEIWRMEI